MAENEPAGKANEPGKPGTDAAEMAGAAIDAAQQAAATIGAAADAPSGQEAADALAAVQAALNEVSSPSSSPQPAGAAKQGTADEPAPFNLPSFGDAPAAEKPANLDLLADVNLNVKIELGRTRMFVEDVLRLSEGAVVELDKLAGDPVDIFVNDRHVARGEVLVLNDNFCVRVNEIIAPVTKDRAA